ncbi:MAG TPA: type II secretion system inner membrane protein GspF [Zeimonas sp.]
MPAYRYEAADPAGQLARGVIDADSPRHARGLLRDRGLAPLEVSAVQDAGPGARSIGARLGAGELALATRQLASLLSARLPIEQALDAVVEQAERQSVRERFAAVRSEVVGGQTLAQALAKHPRDFPEVYRALVSAGEQSGDLALVMSRLADYIESRTALAQRIVLAFTYPAIVTAVAVLVIVAMLAYVVPQVVSVFAQTQQDLPALTVGLIATSDFVRDWGLAVLLLIVAALVAFRVALRSPSFRMSWHRRTLRLPVAGRLIRGLNTARFASTLGILTSSGVPLIRALEAGARTLSNDALRLNVQDAISRVREGASLSRALKAGGQFPPLMIHMIASGEATGELPQMLERTAATLSQETERRTLTLTSLLEPLLILAMGAIVLVIVLAVLLPIIEINDLVR